MPEIHELFNTRHSSESRDSQSLTLEYFLRGLDDDGGDDLDEVARALVVATAPTTFQGLLIDNIDMTYLGGGCATSSVRYSSWMPVNTGTGVGDDPTSPPPPSPPPPPPPAPGNYEPIPSGFSFSITGVTEKITQSKLTVSKTKRGGGVAPDTKQAIGVTADGEVEGCDAIMPQFEWSVTRRFNYITMAYMKTLQSLVGTVNHATFYNHPAQSTLFLGAEGSSQNNGPMTISYKFRSGENRLAIKICDGFIVPGKKAHEYLWVMYAPSPDANMLTMAPIAAYVERIYDLANFASLSIGT